MKNKKIKKLLPPAKIGIIGGGQLGRMITMEAKKQGYGSIVLDSNPDSPAGQIADEQIIARFDNLDALRELSYKADVITYEFEHIDAEILSFIEQDSQKVYPSSETLKIIQDKYSQKKTLRSKGFSVPDFILVDEIESLKSFFYSHNKKIVIKTCTDGYDGKGNVIVKDIIQLEEIYDKLKGYCILAEEFIEYTKELSILVARNDEETVCYPIVENYHEDSILIKSHSPANVSKQVEEKIIKNSIEIVNMFGDYGILCIEYFMDENSNILVNEIAPRPHNSGHYTIEGCVTSQFEQLIRIITGMPLGSTELRKPCAMYNILGNDMVNGPYLVKGLDSALRIEDSHVHIYGKLETYSRRKIGHVNTLGNTLEEADIKAMNTMKYIKLERLKEA